MFSLILGVAMAANQEPPRQILNCHLAGDKEVKTIATGRITKLSDGSYEIVSDDKREGNFKPGAFDSCLLIEAPSNASA